MDPKDIEIERLRKEIAAAKKETEEAKRITQRITEFVTKLLDENSKGCEPIFPPNTKPKSL